MTHSSRKKIWAGALAALLALFAAVVVATPAVADPAEEMATAATAGGYRFNQTDWKDQLPEGVTVTSDDDSVKIAFGETSADVTVSMDSTYEGTPLPIEVTGTAGTITFDSVNVTLTSGTAPFLTLSSTSSATIGFTGTSSISVAGQPVIMGDSLATLTLQGPATGSATATLASTGTKGTTVVGDSTTDFGSSLTTLTAKQNLNLTLSVNNAANGVINDAGAAKLTTVTIGDYTDTTGDATADNTTVTLNDSGTNANAALTLASGTLTVTNGSTLTVSAPVVAPAVQVNGTINTTPASGLSNVSGAGIQAATSITVGASTTVAGTINMAVDGDDATAAISTGTLKVTNGAVTATGNGKAAKGIQGNVGNIALTKGSITATSENSDAINDGGMSVTVAKGSVLTASALGETGSGIVAANFTQTDGTATVSAVGAPALSLSSGGGIYGGTFTATTSAEDTPAISVANTVLVSNGSTYGGATNWKYVVVAGTEGAEEPTDDMMVRAFANSKEDMYQGIGSGNTFGTVEVFEDAVSALTLNVAPANGSAGKSINQGAGYMVVNAVDPITSSDYVYKAVMTPTFSTAIDAPLAPDITLPDYAISSLMNLTNTSTPVQLAGGGIAIPNTVSDITSVSLTANHETDTLSGLYTTPIRVNDNSDIPVSYQVTFNANGGPALVPQLDPVPEGVTPAFANPAQVTSEIIGQASNAGTYFTEPGGTTLVNGVPIIGVESVPVTALPLASKAGRANLGWYPVDNSGSKPVAGPDPIAEIADAYTENTTYVTFWGHFTVTGTVFTNSPLDISAGQKDVDLLANATLVLGENGILKADPKKINIYPSHITYNANVNGLYYVANPAIGATGSLVSATDGIYGISVENAVTVTAGTTQGTYVLHLPVITRANTQQGQYIANVTFPDATTSVRAFINVSGVAPSADVAVWRLYNPYDAGRLYTSSLAELEQAVHNGWNYEGILCDVPAESDMPVYRLYNPYSGDHYYCTSQTEGNYLESLGWVYDFDGGAAFYSAPVDSPVPIYQLFNPYETVNTHMWTSSFSEYINAQADGWEGNDVAWWGVSL